MAARGLFATTLLAGILLHTVAGEAQVTCNCSDARDFGSCIVGTAVTYPGDFPGSVTVAPVEDGTYVFVADLYDGFTYRYKVPLGDGVLTSSTPVDLKLSPGGSLSTTGIAYNSIDGNLYWAVNGKLISTDLDSNSPETLGAIDLDKLRTELSLPAKGVLGGITFFPDASTQDVAVFWAVDIANDVYFRFSAGHVNNKPYVSIDEADGKPIHFANPLRSPRGSGAYGNSIAYVNLAGVPYFDIPVGGILDGSPTQVLRIHAADGGEGDAAYALGDPTGVFYPIETATGATTFISGIGYFPATCGDTDPTEFLLDMAGPGAGKSPRILQLSVHDPASAAVTNFRATYLNDTLTLTWTVPLAYDKLDIKRQLLPSGPVVAVTTFNASDTDPRSYQEVNLPDGLYQYSATVTPRTPGRKFPAVTAQVVVGQGSILASASFTAADRPADSTPGPIAYIRSKDQVLVADTNTGNVRLFSGDLTPISWSAGPFVRDAQTGGTTTGLAWEEDPNDPSAAGKLLWVLTTSGGCFLQRTELNGALVGKRVPLKVPSNLRRVPSISGISYDALDQWYWGVDTVNMVAYSFDAAGNLTGKSATTQLACPRTGSLFGGGIAVMSATATSLILDFTVGKGVDYPPSDLARVAYTRTGQDLSTGTETFALDLRTILQSVDIGGLAATSRTEGSQKVNIEYVVGVDTATIFKLRMDSTSVVSKSFRRGDVNGDGTFNISDPVGILLYQFKAGTLPCAQAADANGDGKNPDLTDALYLFNYLFLSGTEPPAPFPDCGQDFAHTLPCDTTRCQ